MSTNVQSTRVGASSSLNALDWIAMIILIIGGLNWGLVGLFSFDLIAAIFGSMSVISRIIYVVVGLSALYAIYLMVRVKNIGSS